MSDVQSLPVIEVESSWPMPKRVAFRFLFTYFVLYVFPFPITYLLMPFSQIFKSIAMFSGWLSREVNTFWDTISCWVGNHWLGIEGEIFTGPTGSGDTTVDYIKLLLMLLISVSVCVIWSLVDFRRRGYPWLSGLLIMGTRYNVGFALMGYGFAKLIKTQFPFPSLQRLLQPIGDMSPMGLTWTYMGYSHAYNLFTGGGEVLGGLLLLFRRTRALGALVVIGVMVNVAAINYCFDVPVKLFSTHLLLMACLLLALDGRRLMNLLIWNRLAEPAEINRCCTRLRWYIPGRIFKFVVIAVVIGTSLIGGWRAYRSFGEGRQKPPLYGVHDVTEFVADGETVPPLVTDPQRWSALIVDRAMPMFGRPGMIVIRKMDGSMIYRQVAIDPDNQTMTLTDMRTQSQIGKFSYERPSATTLVLLGNYDGKEMEIKFTTRDLQSFELVRRGFHWINEYPRNR